MDTEQIFKLLMEIGPNSSDAFIYWIGLEVFKDITSTKVKYKRIHPVIPDN